MTVVLVLLGLALFLLPVVAAFAAGRPLRKDHQL